MRREKDTCPSGIGLYQTTVINLNSFGWEFRALRGAAKGLQPLDSAKRSGFRAVRGATKGRCPLETCGL